MSTTTTEAKGAKQALWTRCGPQLQAFIRQGVADGLTFEPPIFDYEGKGERVYVVKY